MCGILALYTPSTQTLSPFVEALSELQHRGYESYGIVHKLFSKEPTLTVTEGKVSGKTVNQNILYNLAIGHVRYSTVNKSDHVEAQPIKGSNYYLVHNGNLPLFNTKHTGLDTYHIVKKLDQQIQSNTIEGGLIHLINTLPGVYCLIVLYNDALYVCRDKFGIRPLLIATYEDKSKMIASETVAFSPGYTHLFEVKAGSILRVANDIQVIHQATPLPKEIFCSFEIIYFMHHLSKVGDHSVSELRYRLGELLASSEPSTPSSDSIVVAMPNTAIPGAQGYANTLRLPYFPYITKAKAADRTFILPDNKQRIAACKRKFIFNEQLKDKVVYVVDDSIVRGNTLAITIKQLREIPVKEIHLRITSPPVISSCYYGIDIPTYQELVAHKKDVPEICTYLNADSLSYLSINQLKMALGNNICTACFDDKHHNVLLDW